MSDRIVVLGAEDPEMRAIEARLNAMGIEYAQALDQYGNAVHCGATDTALIRLAPEIIRRSGLVVIETRVPQFEDETEVIIDHHHEGDRGYDMPIDEAVAASSLGQSAAYFGFNLTERERTLGAVDHSFIDVMAGDVTNIDPEYGLAVKIEEIVATHNTSTEYVRSNIAVARELIQQSPKFMIGDMEVADLSQRTMGLPNSMEKLALQTAAAIDQRAIFFCFQEYPDGPMKVMLNGAASRDSVELFRDEWVPILGLERPFGVPSRHYAGAYISHPEYWLPPSEMDLGGMPSVEMMRDAA